MTNITEIILGLIAAMMSMVAFAMGYAAYSFYSMLERLGAKRAVSFSERIQRSLSKISSASQEIDTIVQDIVKDIRNRRTALEELKTRYQSLLQEEKKLSERVEMLKDVPIEVARYFEQVSEEGLRQMEWRRAKRDFIMVVLGIVLTTVITILLRVFS